MIEEGNATITHVKLGKEDHGIPTFSLTLEGQGWGQGFGGYDLRHESHGIDLLMRILDTVGVMDWSNLKGKVVRFRRDGQFITAIGHIVEDKWLEMNP